MLHHSLFAVAALVGLLVSGSQAVTAADVPAGPPRALSVTVYRAPSRESGGIQLDRLGGFALVNEEREVSLPAGESRLRFDGVADGIDVATAIVTGLAGVVLEKNQDAELLTPAALLRASVGKTRTLMRTNRKSGIPSYVQGIVRAATDSSVVFESGDGIEALGCSGVPQSFVYSAATDLSSSPTLSVLVRTERPVSGAVTLSYLSRGFDWAADYVAQLAPDGKSVDLGAWVTLANGNGIGFPAARVQVVAGRVNRAGGNPVDTVPEPATLIAQCWPQGTTSDAPLHPAADASDRLMLFKGSMMDIVVTAHRVEMALAAPTPAPATVQQEDLGDLKLYRVPESTTLASRQSKQVRLLDRTGIPVRVVYQLDTPADVAVPDRPAQRVLRSKNNQAYHLGLPIPSGHVSTFISDRSNQVLIGESGLRDTAVDEVLEVPINDSADVQVKSTVERIEVGADTKIRVRGAIGYRAGISAVNRVDIVSSRSSATPFELRLRLNGNDHIVGADRPFTLRDGRTVFEVNVPAGGTVTLRYQTDRTRYTSIDR